MAAETKWGLGNPKVVAMKQVVDTVAAANITFYNTYGPGGNWADDYGWWGIAALTAKDYFAKHNDPVNASKYLAIAKNCWNQMYGKGYDKNDTARPVPHGCANAGGANTGTKNTITNVNLLLLSIRLYREVKNTGDPDAQKYLAMCYAQYVWFATWFTNSYSGFTYLRVPPATSQIVYGRLVQERPIAEPDYERESDPTWQEGWTWTADQGLVMTALIELTEITDDIAGWIAAENPSVRFGASVFRSEIDTWIESIATAVKLTLFSTPDQVLREAPFDSSFIDDPKDYVCGRGVLLRYLAQIKDKLPNVDLDKNILATAEAALGGTSNGANQFAANWTSTDSDLVFNMHFKSLWGYGNISSRWPSTINQSAIYNGILQALGLDVLGAAIPLI
jgi:hypothetical protein